MSALFPDLRAECIQLNNCLLGMFLVDFGKANSTSLVRQVCLTDHVKDIACNADSK